MDVSIFDASVTLFGRLSIRRAQDDCRLAGDDPVLLRFQRRGTVPSIARILARPKVRPLPPGQRGKERFGGRIEIQIAAEIDHQEAILAGAEIT